jgi:hypothetical protein
VDGLSARERGIGREDHLATVAEQLDIEKLEHARVPQDGPSHRGGDEPDDRLPLALLETVREPERLRGVTIGDGDAYDRSGFPFRSLGQVDPQAQGQIAGE